MQAVQEYFYGLADCLVGDLRGEEVLLLNFSGEDSDFVRFNHSAIRQAGSVSQRALGVELVAGSRHVRSVCTLSGQAATDRRRARAAVASLRQDLPDAPEDPHLLYATEVRSSNSVGVGRLPPPEVAVEAVLAAGRRKDLVGLLAQGGIFAGFANSLGQRNWFAIETFSVDWSFHLAADKAVKSSYAGFEWDEAAFRRKVASATRQLPALSRPARTIQPGPYRVYLAPEALREYVGAVAWGGFGLKAHRTKSTSLLQMIEQGKTLSPSVTLLENTAEGMSPHFQSGGFVRPDEVTLIDQGRLRDCLVSPRSAKEYGVATNGASEGESPRSLDMAPGDVPEAEAFQRLGRGVFVSNLWYLNYSDRPACRITGMTRFATFWVEGGQLVAPLNVMRFDETVYRVLGANLLGLTAEREFMPSSKTYHARSTDSARLPGALVKDFRLTL